MPDLNSQNTALIEAINECNLIHARGCLDQGADPNCIDEEEEPVLFLAINARLVNIVRLLLERGAWANSETYEQCPLVRASSLGDREIAELLLKHDALLNGDPEKGIPLHEAAKRGSNEMVALLLEQGADVNAVDDEGYTALVFTAMFGRFRAANLLLEAGAAPYNQLGEPIMTPLHWAIQEEFSGIARLLLEHGANVEAEEENGIRPLAMATSAGNLEAVKLLLEFNADVNGGESSQNPFMNAAIWEHWNIAEYLLQHGADINGKDAAGDTALIMNAESGDVEGVKWLLARGADVSCTNCNGETALQRAREERQSEVVKLLEQSLRH